MKRAPFTSFAPPLKSSCPSPFSFHDSIGGVENNALKPCTELTSKSINEPKNNVKTNGEPSTANVVKVERIILGKTRKVGLSPFIHSSKDTSKKGSPTIKDFRKSFLKSHLTESPSLKHSRRSETINISSSRRKSNITERVSCIKNFVPGLINAFGSTHLPILIMGYLQVAFNAILIAGILYFIVSFVLTVRRDVEIKVDQQLSRMISEIAQCSKQYRENRCDPKDRVPAMEATCQAWEACMHQDPSLFGRAKLSAETFAEIVNGLIEPISFKTMVSFTSHSHYPVI